MGQRDLMGICSITGRGGRDRYHRISGLFSASGRDARGLSSGRDVPITRPPLSRPFSTQTEGACCELPWLREGPGPVPPFPPSWEHSLQNISNNFSKPHIHHLLSPLTPPMGSSTGAECLSQEPGSAECLQTLWSPFPLSNPPENYVVWEKICNLRTNDGGRRFGNLGALNTVARLKRGKLYAKKF